MADGKTLVPWVRRFCSWFELCAGATISDARVACKHEVPSVSAR